MSSSVYLKTIFCYLPNSTPRSLIAEYVFKISHYPLLNKKIMLFCVPPCPCGYYGDSQKPCTWAPAVVTKYQKRISSPLLNHIDIHAECVVGWIAHYIIGIIFAVTFVAIVGNKWLQHPSLIPALLFGLITVSAPFFIMQPAFGLGVAASKSTNPAQARLRSLINHIVFGFGLYASGSLVRLLL